MADVDYNKKNLERCMCLSCPVQIDSVCANERKLKVLDMLANYEEGSLLMESSQIAALYCSIGKSGCGDIDTEQMCQLL